MKFLYLPRIRCLDCQGKAYTAGPDRSTANFEIHLKNRLHRERVDARVGKPTSPDLLGAPSQGTASSGGTPVATTALPPIKSETFTGPPQ